MKPNITAVGAILTIAIVNSGHYAAEIARQTGIPESTLSKIKQGKAKLHPRYVDDVCAVLPRINRDALTRAVEAQYRK